MTNVTASPKSPRSSQRLSFSLFLRLRLFLAEISTIKKRPSVAGRVSLPRRVKKTLDLRRRRIIIKSGFPSHCTVSPTKGWKNYRDKTSTPTLILTDLFPPTLPKCRPQPAACAELQSTFPFASPGRAKPLYSGALHMYLASESPTRHPLPTRQDLSSGRLAGWTIPQQHPRKATAA